MDNILPGLDDDEVATKVAQRAACFYRGAKMGVDSINRQFSAFVESYLQRPRVAALLADAETTGLLAEVRERVMGLIQDQFVPSPSGEDDAAIAALRSTGNRILPAKFASQKWSPDTCECKVHQIRDTSLPGNPSRTFQAKSCDPHKTLSMGERHDAILRENALKNDFINTIVAAVPSAVNATWSFNVARMLVVNVAALLAPDKILVQGIAGRPKFTGKVIVNG